MAIKPTDKPVWANDDTTLPIAGTANKLKPRLTWQNTGVDRESFATAQEFNWLFNNQYKWFNYLEAFTEELEFDISTLEGTTSNHETRISNIENAPYQSLAQINTLIANALDDYEDAKEPVGTVLYLTVGTDPNTFKRGTWVKTASGKFIVGQDTGDVDFNSIGETGGSKTHIHTVPVDNWGENPNNGPMPSPSTGGKLVVGSGQTELSETLESITHAAGDSNTSSTSNVPPYQVMVIWEKTVL